MSGETNVVHVCHGCPRKHCHFPMGSYGEICPAPDLCDKTPDEMTDPEYRRARRVAGYSGDTVPKRRKPTSLTGGEEKP